ncbi:hypothetical protein JVU11DRAFT_11264 [Chiua virens]|nr:hypothetical protein JVU11DRAFT_11264 [Chiua virens]
MSLFWHQKCATDPLKFVLFTFIDHNDDDDVNKNTSTMDDAWNSQDIAPSGISIPTDTNMNGGPPHGDEPSWNGGVRSPGRDRGGEPPRRSSRSRSPGRDDRGPREGGGLNPGNNLHVSGLSHRVDTRDLEQTFAKIGRVKKASVMYDPHTRESRGFGFVTMETAEEADAAITALNATEIMGKIATVEKARRGRARTPTPGRYYGPPKRHDCHMTAVTRATMSIEVGVQGVLMTAHATMIVVPTVITTEDTADATTTAAAVMTTGGTNAAGHRTRLSIDLGFY